MPNEFTIIQYTSLLLIIIIDRNAPCVPKPFYTCGKMDKWPMTKQVMFATYYILLFDFKII